MRRCLAASAIALALVAGACLGGCRAVTPPAPSSAHPATAPATLRPGDGGRDPESGLPWIAPAQLPPEGRSTLALIDKGGPFPHGKDGTTFRNAERRLPAHRSGYYREYTVETPGSSDRGARRIVCGQHRDCYYTGDHYSTFERIRR